MRNFRPTETEIAFGRQMLDGADALQNRLNSEMPADWKKRGVKIHVKARVGGGNDNPFDHRTYPAKFTDFFDQLRGPEWLPSWSLGTVAQHANSSITGGHDVTASKYEDAICWQELDAIVQICGAFEYDRGWSEARYLRQPDANAAIAQAVDRANAEEPPRYRLLLDYLIEEGALGSRT